MKINWKKSFTLVGFLLSAMLVLGTANAKDVLLYGGNQDIDNIDPATGENYSINAALRSLYDALFIYRGENMEPNLVESWTASDDAKVWTFTLREGPVFHDGSPVTAESVVYSFNRILEISGPPSWRWSNVADENTAQVIGARTVQFTLTKPFAPFLSTLPQLFVVNPAIVEANRGDDFGQTYLRLHEAGSGPFTQGRWEIGNVYEFVAVDDYWAGWKNDKHLDGALWIIQRDAATQKNSLLAGETHIADTIAGSDKDEVGSTPGFHITEDVGFFIDTLKMNTQGKYTGDINLRKAIAHAMNYDVLPTALDVRVTIIPGPTPSNFIGYTKAEVPTYDLDKAREYLAKTPWPNGGITLDYVYVTQFPREEIPGLILLEGLSKIGITLNMKPMLWPDMVSVCGSVDTGPDLINIYTLPSFLDPDALLYRQYHSEQWGSYASCNFYKNDDVDAKLDEARVIGDMDQRLALYADAQRQIIADQPSVWMYTEDSLEAFNDCVKGYVYSPLYPITVLFQDLWMDGCN